MRQELTKKILQNISPEKKCYLRKHTDIVFRIRQLLNDKGYTQQAFANKMGKQPSEISKWFKGVHNFTLKSITKMEAELGEDIINIPYQKQFVKANGGSFNLTMQLNEQHTNNLQDSIELSSRFVYSPSKVG